LAIERAVFIGHDFGGSVAWTLARDHPERALGVASLNTPYTRRGRKNLLALMKQHRGLSNYMVAFQAPGAAEAIFERDVAGTFRALMRRPLVTLAEFRDHASHLHALPMSLFAGEPAVMGEPLMPAEELQAFVKAFERTGFSGPLNWYRNLELNWIDTASVRERIDLPALMVSAADDYFLPPETTRGMEEHIGDLERHVIPNCGHWTQHEAPETVNALLTDWLARRIRPIAGVLAG
jgi:pimeloyl-ACP methyl ester carboxylesterase